MILKDTRPDKEIHENLHPADSESIKKEEHTLGMATENKVSGSVTFTSKSEAIMFINSLMDVYQITIEELE